MKFTLEQLQNSKVWKDPKNRAQVAAAIGAAPGVGPVGAHQLQPNEGPSLVKAVRKREAGKGGLALVVTLIAIGPNAADDDNFSTGAKPLRDAIAASLGVDDGDKRVKWQYATFASPGPSGTIVLIQEK